MAVPSVDQKTKREKLIFSRPAGTDTSERTVGTIRPRNTKAAPKRSNHRWPRWISSQVMVIHRPQRSTHGLIRSSPNARSEEHTSELQSLMRISYAVFCL